MVTTVQPFTPRDPPAQAPHGKGQGKIDACMHALGRTPRRQAGLGETTLTWYPDDKHQSSPADVICMYVYPIHNHRLPPGHNPSARAPSPSPSPPPLPPPLASAHQGMGFTRDKSQQLIATAYSIVAAGAVFWGWSQTATISAGSPSSSSSSSSTRS